MPNDRIVTTRECIVLTPSRNFLLEVMTVCFVKTVHGDYQLPDILGALFMRLIIFAVAIAKSMSR